MGSGARWKLIPSLCVNTCVRLSRLERESNLMDELNGNTERKPLYVPEDVLKKSLSRMANASMALSWKEGDVGWLAVRTARYACMALIVYLEVQDFDEVKIGLPDIVKWAFYNYYTVNGKRKKVPNKEAFTEM